MARASRRGLVAAASPAGRRGPRLAYGALAAAGALWGASFPLGKMALAEMGPAYLVLYRFAIATVLLVPLALRAPVRPTRADGLRLAALAFLMGPLMFLVQFEDLARTTASSAALLVGIAPPALAVAAALFDGERPGPRTWAAVAVSALGAALLVGTPGPGRTALGDALVAAGMLASVAWTLLSRRLGRRLGALPTTAYQFALGALWLVPFAVLSEGAPPVHLSAGVWGAVAALGVACTAAAFGLWNWGMLHGQAARGGVFTNLEPLVGAGLGVVVLGEALGPATAAGGLLILAAAWMVTQDR